MKIYNIHIFAHIIVLIHNPAIPRIGNDTKYRSRFCKNISSVSIYFYPFKG